MADKGLKKIYLLYNILVLVFFVFVFRNYGLVFSYVPRIDVDVFKIGYGQFFVIRDFNVSYVERGVYFRIGVFRTYYFPEAHSFKVVGVVSDMDGRNYSVVKVFSIGPGHYVSFDLFVYCPGKVKFALFKILYNDVVVYEKSVVGVIG